jgi:glycogen synthase
MRLLLTTDTVGGVWDYAATLSSALADDGHAVLLAIIGHPTDDQLAQLSEEIAIESRFQRLEWMTGSSADLAVTARWLANLARGWRSDLVHLNQMVYPGITTFAVPTLVVVHSDVCSWHLEVRGSPPGAEWRGYVDAVRAGLRSAHAVVAPSLYQAAFVKRFYDRRDVSVIHNGTDRGSVDARTAKEPLVLSVGRAWDEAKGAGVLDRALGLVRDRTVEGHFVGPMAGPDGSTFSAQALRCHDRASREEVGHWLARAAIYVAPSLYEPFGLAPVEAASSDCALVLSDIGSFRELWQDCAEFFPKGDAHALASAISRLVNDPGRRTELATKARRRAAERYSVDRFVDGYFSLYATLRRASPTLVSMPAAQP